MKVLSIETATEICGAALIEGSKILANEFREEPRTHSEKIVAFIEGILRSTNTPLRAVDGIAVSIGPGSFTGLRIGLSVAKGLAFSADKPLTAVSTLEALARNPVAPGDAKDSGLLLALIDARRDELYAAAYRRNGGSLTCVISPRAVKIPDLYNLLDAEQKIILVGNGTGKFQEYLMTADHSDRFIIPLREQRICSAVSVALIGAEQFARGESADVASLEPFYVKEFHTSMKPSRAVKF